MSEQYAENTQKEFEETVGETSFYLDGWFSVGAKKHPRNKNTETIFSQDRPGIFWGFCLGGFSPPEGMTPDTEMKVCHPHKPRTIPQTCLCLCFLSLAIGDRKGTTKKLCDKDFAERLGELSGAICLKVLVLLGDDR